MNQTIVATSSDPTLAFAAEELATYIEKITGDKLPLKISPESTFEGPGFCIQCDGKLAQTEGTDEYSIRTENNLVMLTGNRPRSCLYAVYAYLEEQGVRFLRPGPDGEIVPKRSKLKRRIGKRARASHDHRCVCIEGAVSKEHALAVVDWLAKHRMNEFFLQFESGRVFWNRWYNHELNPHFDVEKFTDGTETRRRLSIAEAKQLDEILIREIKKRDIDLFRMGHGWTSRSLGVMADGWNKSDKKVPEELGKRLALLRGRREWHQGIPANTELCYSNSDAFGGVVNTVVEYATEHPEADLLLFCQADGINQHCECPECGKLSVSDWYLKLVNSISEAIAERGLPTKICFDAYANTAHAPEIEYVRDNFKNVIFMFAPFFRCYEHALAYPHCLEDYPVGKAVRNHAPTVTGNRAYVQLLRNWQARTSADSVLADYFFNRLHCMLLDEMFVARRVYSDIVDLLSLGFNGLLSCQVLRSFYPTALGMTIVAELLWDRTLTFEEITKSHMKNAYGRFSARVVDYLDGTTAILKPTPDGHDHLIYWAKDKDQAARAIAYLACWHEKLREMRTHASDPVHIRSLDYLIHHNKLLSFVCQAAECFASGDVAGVRARLDDATLFACETEFETHWVLDTWMVNYWQTERILRWKDGPKWFKDEKH